MSSTSCRRGHDTVRRPLILPKALTYAPTGGSNSTSGEVLDGLHLTREAGLAATDAGWNLQRALLDFLEGEWRRPDNGLWEVRGNRRQFVHSKVMAWTGFARAVTAVERHGLDGPVDRWRAARDDIHAEVCAKGFDVDRNTFTQSYGSTALDATLLLIPRVGFLPRYDPASGHHLGNTPQAFSLIGLVNSTRLLSGTLTQTSADPVAQRARRPSG